MFFPFRKVWNAIREIAERLEALEECRNRMKLEHDANMTDLERLYNKLRMQLNRAEQLRAADPDEASDRSGLADAVRARRGF